ncbi:MAG: DUF11 domain-containing protein, partial [Patescibacteria group bacterium]|nr:DUF11 domain-containing protein [Patescibacteria group bacterium]
FRVVAQDSIGLHYSASQTFTTLSAPQQNTANGQTSYNANSGAVTTFIQPTAITNEAMLVHENSAVINGTVNPENSPTSAWFEYSSDPNLYNANKSIPETVGSDNADKYMAYALSNLILGQTYYFRTVAQNSYGTTYGSIKSFTTRIAPVAIRGLSTADQSTEPSSSLKTSNHQAPASSKLFSLEAEFDNNNPRPGKEIVYNISYENTGDSNASNVVLEVTLPNEAIYESSSYANVGKNGNTLSFKVGNVSAKSSGIISIKIKITDLTKSASLQFNDSLSYSESGKSGNTNLVSELKLNHNQLTASVIDLLGNILNNTIVDLLIGILTGLAIYHFAIRKKQNIITDDPLK